MGEKFCHPIPESDPASDIVKWNRDARPAHYTLKIDSFSFLLELLEKIKAKCYDSEIFEACGYKWKLSLYPNGDEERDGTGHISLYLIAEDTSALPLGWEINASFKFFVYNQIQDNYLTIQDGGGKVRRFHEMKKEWGLSKLLQQNIFKDSSKGYLIQDKCLFGVEIFVNSCTGRGECLALPVNRSGSTYTWKVHNYSGLNDECHSSPVFTLANCKWKLYFYPEGKWKDGKNFSFYLELEDLKTTPKVYAEFKLCIKDQKNQKHKENIAHNWYCASHPSWGWHSSMSVNDIRDASKGYLVKDTLVLQVEITRISILKKFS